MTTKLQTILPVILLLITLVLRQSGVVALGAIDVTSRKLDATNIASPIGHANIRKNGGRANVVRYLEGGEENNHRKKTQPFFHVLLATIVVNIVTLVGLLSLIPVLLSKRWSSFKSAFWVANKLVHEPNESTKLYWNVGKSIIDKNDPMYAKDAKGQTKTLLSDLFVPSYVCGTILATTLFLVIPEAIVFIQRGTSSFKGEIEILPGTIARFGAAFMTGYMLPLFLGALFPRAPEYICSDEFMSSSDSTTMAAHKSVPSKRVDEEAKCDEDGYLGATDSKDTSDESTCNNGEINECSTLEENPTSSSISMGASDFNDHPSDTKVSFENEGVKTPKPQKINSRMASDILIGAALHNFFDGMFIGAAFMTCSNATAVCLTIITIWNEITQQAADYFLLTKCAGISIPRALLLIFASSLSDVIGALVIVGANLGNMGIGILLAFAAGVYLHISASDCLPRVYAVVIGSRDRWNSLGFFVIGTLPIGLSLLKHGHCDA